jgi:hypothetical protein
MNSNRAPKTLQALRESLQQAHFAARALRQDVPSDQAGDLADQIHRIRLLAERLAPQSAMASTSPS